jgi:polyisoprenoid-binding protein YceI
MKKILLISWIIIINQATAQSVWKVDDFIVQFSVKNAGFIVKGNLGELKADINFDSKAYTQSSIKGSVAVNTIKTGNSTRDSHLQKEEYFNQALYPTIQLASSFFGKTESGFKGYFKLTIKGTTKDVIIPFTWNDQGKFAILKGSFSLNRLDYGIGTSSLILNNDITIFIEIKLSH